MEYVGPGFILEHWDFELRGLLIILTRSRPGPWRRSRRQSNSTRWAWAGSSSSTSQCSGHVFEASVTNSLAYKITWARKAYKINGPEYVHPELVGVESVFADGGS